MLLYSVKMLSTFLQCAEPPLMSKLIIVQMSGNQITSVQVYTKYTIITMFSCKVI